MAGLPGGPVQAPPRGFIPPAEQAQILADVLAGIELGAWDRQIARWLAGWDTSTLGSASCYPAVRGWTV
jgi:hypothetical protein